ncbi:glycosyltransferase family 4 protein [uncultured Algibacter sp.]|uniref:glycosyltransferase family 4 protein n=1 Tax=uncultured Algibacter sp. TaxID=298659 RepID=UPI00260DD0D4|nr:glycosyltransferase family 4 protein [uncultured Algibacter sp.]
MKTLIYIGNKSGVSKRANLSSIDVLAPLLVKAGYTVYSASKSENRVVRLVSMLWTCFKYRKKADYVLIDTYSTLNFYYAFFVSQLCQVLKLKYLPILHGGNLPERLKSSSNLSKSIFNNAYINVAPSMFIKSKFEASGFNNVINIPNSIELKNYPFKERTFDSIKLLWVRSFSKIYNPLLAIDVMKAFENEYIKVKLCMVGPDNDGTLQDAKKYADKLDVDVRFTGKLSKKEWIELSKEYNIFINTTNFDNMPVSVIEAMALGLPVISTNVGGMPFLIENDKSGILVKPNSSEAFVESIKKLSSSEDYAQNIIQEARLNTEKLDWEIVKKQWIKVLK